MLLEWSDWYYNGDMKTRKTVQPVELNADEMGLQRSEQLRELYASLSAGDSNPQAKRPSASLSPKDKSHRFRVVLFGLHVFHLQLWSRFPGRACASGLHIWLCNAHHADSKVFSCSLLAKDQIMASLFVLPQGSQSFDPSWASAEVRVAEPKPTPPLSGSPRLPVPALSFCRNQQSEKRAFSCWGLNGDEGGPEINRLKKMYLWYSTMGKGRGDL